MSAIPALNIGVGRNAILDALLKFFEGIAPWATASRKFRLWDNVQQSERPALFLLFNGEDRIQGGEGLPPMIILDVSVFVYVWSPPETPVPSDLLGNILDSFDKALAPLPLAGNRQTLGNLVSHCWVEGKTLVVPGDLEGDGLAVIPLKILLPS